MKLLKKMVLSFLVLELSMSLPAALFANEGYDESAFIKLLQDSAAALQSSQPALSTDLRAFANEETEEMKEEMNETKEQNDAEEAKEKNTLERQALRAAHLKLLQESAAALQTTHPDLAVQLTKRADRTAKKMSEKK